MVGFWLLRQMERWLHQHIFKLGWLLTKDFRTTTVLFYVLFLPGIVLHEVALFFAASFLNVRAERILRFPQVQEIADLKINFIRLSPRAPRWKIALIELAPPLVGVIVISAIANGILNINAALTVMRTGDLADVGTGMAMLTAKPDFWLWTFILFTIANTMTPRFTAQRALRPVLIGLGVLGIVLASAGLIDQVLAPVIDPIVQFVNVLAVVFAVTVAINTSAIFVLGVIEQSIERVTGNSAEFVRGRLVAKSRAEILAERQAERERLAKQKEAEKKRTPSALEGVPSVYRLTFPLPGPPETGRSTRAEPPPPVPVAAEMVVNVPKDDEPDAEAQDDEDEAAGSSDG
ncbi:MAG: hypothetical protein MUF38_19160 [Anaerolineae bacterium]|nr:hypothetical protein [Anaerolineae bacterium]